MVRVYYSGDGKGKLVRDKIASKIESESHVVKFRKLDNDEKLRELTKKITEESAEVAEAINSGNKEEH